MENIQENSQKCVEAIDVVTIDNQSNCSETLRKSVKEKVFKLQSQLIEGLKEIQKENTNLNLAGMMIFNFCEPPHTEQIKTEIKILLTEI